MISVKRSNLVVILAALTGWAVCGGTAHAGELSCGQDSTGPYCTYRTYVDRAYVNVGNSSPWVLVYFPAVDLSIAQAAGMTNVTKTTAAQFRISDEPTFGQYLYSTALTALTAEKEVVLFLREDTTYFGYFKIERIWIDR